MQSCAYEERRNQKKGRVKIQNYGGVLCGVLSQPKVQHGVETYVEPVLSLVNDVTEQSSISILKKTILRPGKQKLPTTNDDEMMR